MEKISLNKNTHIPSDIEKNLDKISLKTHRYGGPPSHDSVTLRSQIF